MSPAAEVQNIALVESDHKIAILKLGPFFVVVLRESLGLWKEEEVELLIDVQGGVGEAPRTRTRGLEAEVAANMQAPSVSSLDVRLEPAVFRGGQLLGVDAQKGAIHDLVDLKTQGRYLGNGNLQHGSVDFSRRGSFNSGERVTKTVCLHCLQKESGRRRIRHDA